MPASRSRGEGTSTTPRRSDFAAAAESRMQLWPPERRVGEVCRCIMARSLFLASLLLSLGLKGNLAPRLCSLAFVPRLCRVPCPRVHFIKGQLGPQCTALARPKESFSYDRLRESFIERVCTRWRQTRSPHRRCDDRCDMTRKSCLLLVGSALGGET